MPSRSYYLSDDEDQRFAYTIRRLDVGPSDFARLAVKILLGDPVPAAFADVVDELLPELRELRDRVLLDV